MVECIGGIRSPPHDNPTPLELSALWGIQIVILNAKWGVLREWQQKPCFMVFTVTTNAGVALKKSPEMQELCLK